MIDQFSDEMLQKVAVLYCEGMKKQDIAKILFINENDVQKIIEGASQRGYFDYKPVLSANILNTEICQFVSNEVLIAALKNSLHKKFECILTPITITPSPLSMFTKFAMNPDESSEDFNNYLDAERSSVQIAASRAAEKLSRILFDGEDHVIGLNWGAVVGETIKRIHPLPSHLGDGHISVVSLFGDLDFFASEDDQEPLGAKGMNCNNLVTQLVQRLGDRGEVVPLNVPGFIPAKFAKDKHTFDAIRTFMTNHSSYRRIFGGLPPENPRESRKTEGISSYPSQAKISFIDTILTGLGVADSYTVFRNYHTSLLDTDEIQSLLKYCETNQVVGDIGGHLIESKEGGEIKEVIRFLTKINRRLLAAQPSDFIDVASRHLKNNKGAGVVVVTVGARKAKVLFTLLSWSPCPISMVITDTHCALALLY
ncbi:hypothetical protein MUP95_07800, partial [bacterium]|nr:hypothetical protein [bacterium]